MTVVTTKSLLKQPAIDFLSLVNQCTHGPISREHFAINLLRAYGSEFQLLINSSSTPEQQNPPKEITMGEYMFPRHQWHELIEVNRTAQMIYLWVLIVAGRYDLFTECQKPEAKLTLESFTELQVLVDRYLGNDPFKIISVIQRLKIAMAGMSIHDVGKSRGLVSDILKSIGVTEFDMEDHDSLLKTLLKKAPHKISDSFHRLTNEEMRILESFFSIDLILGQVAQGETTGAHIEISGLRLVDQDIRYMWYMKEVLDIAGAVGQSVQNGSVVLTEETWQGISEAIKALEQYTVFKHDTGTATMKALIQQRLSPVCDEIAKMDASEVADSEVAVWGRLVMMLRKFSRVDIKQVHYLLMTSHAALGASEDQRQIDLRLVFGLYEDDGKPSFLPYYAPALFANLIKHLGYDNGVRTGLVLLSRVFGHIEGLLPNVTSKQKTIFLEGLAKSAAQYPNDILTKELVVTVTTHGEYQVSIKE